VSVCWVYVLNKTIHALLLAWRDDMGWLRLVGSLKLYVFFAKEPYKRDYILQKRPMIWAHGGEAHRAEAAARHQGRPN